MPDINKLAFKEIYMNFNNKVVETGSYIENYKEMIYDYLKLAMYENFKDNKINERIKSIFDYCDLVISIVGLPKPIKESFKLIKGDYQYLYLSKNVDYLFKDIFDLRERVGESIDYVDDIISDIKCHTSQTDVNLNFVTIMKIIKNQEKVLDKNLLNIFIKSFC